MPHAMKEPDRSFIHPRSILVKDQSRSYQLTARRVRLNLGGAVNDPTDPVGRLLFKVLALIAQFEADLIRRRILLAQWDGPDHLSME